MTIAKATKLLGCMMAAVSLIPPARAQSQTNGSGPSATGPSSAVAAPATLPSLDQLGSALNSPQSRQDERDEAARRLVVRQDGDARRILADALLNAAQPAAQLSAAKSLVDDPHPDPSLIFPLFNALVVPQVSAAASRALVNYRDYPDVFAGFASRVQGQGRVGNDVVRQNIIRALGSFVEKRTAGLLIDLLRSPVESIATRAAATDALTELTGLTENGPDVSRWVDWWQQNATRPDSEFKSEMLARRSARLDQLKLDLSEVSQALSGLMRQIYQEANGARKQELLLNWLKSPRSEERFIATGLILDDLTTGLPVSATAREQLRRMIGDTAARVRLKVATALYQINDADSIDLLVAQLSIEPEPQIRAALAQAIAPIKSMKAAPALIKLLSDPYAPAAIEAAQALGALGQTIHDQDPKLAEQAATALRDKLQPIPADQSNAELREALVDAMVPLRQQAIVQPTLLRILMREQGPESAGMRRNAIKVIGEFGDQALAPTIINSLADKQSNVRLEAVTALGKLPPRVEILLPLLALSGPPEPDQSVRDKAWTVLESIFPHLTIGQLNDLADKEELRADPGRRVSVLKALQDILLKNKNMEELADVRYNIGMALMSDPKNAGAPPDVAAAREAATYIRPALDYRLSQPNAPQVTIEGMTRDLMKALLRGAQYPEAIAFAAESLRRDNAYQNVMGTSITAQAQELSKNGKFDDVLKLVELTKTMAPRLDQQYQKALEDLERFATDQKNLQGVTPGYPRRPSRQVDVFGPTTRSRGSASARD